MRRAVVAGVWAVTLVLVGRTAYLRGRADAAKAASQQLQALQGLTDGLEEEETHAS